MSELTRDDFAAQLNTTFDIFLTDDAAVEAELIEVTEQRKLGKAEGFAILFLAPLTAPIIQQNCKVEHPTLGSFELFLVPVGQNEAGIQYESVFNRLVD